MSATGDFYDYRDTDSFGRVYQVHRRSIKPAMRVCREWGSLLLNEQTRVVCEDQTCTDWLDAYFSNTGFMGQAQANIARAFGLGTGAFALFFDIGRRKIKIRHFDARMVVPLTWDAEGVTECAFVTRAYYRGKPVDQLQTHVIGEHVTASPSESFTMENGEGALWALRRVAEVWGGEVEPVIAVADGRVATRAIRFVERLGSWRGLRFTYGKNMAGCTHTVLEQDVYTALYGFGTGLPVTSPRCRTKWPASMAT